MPLRSSHEKKNFKLDSLFEIHQRKSFPLSRFSFQQSQCQRWDLLDKIPRHIFSFAPPLYKEPKLQKWHRQNFKLLRQIPRERMQNFELLHPRFIRKQNCKSNAGKILTFFTRFSNLLDKIPRPTFSFFFSRKTCKSDVGKILNFCARFLVQGQGCRTDKTLPTAWLSLTYQQLPTIINNDQQLSSLTHGFLRY